MQSNLGTPHRIPDALLRAFAVQLIYLIDNEHAINIYSLALVNWQQIFALNLFLGNYRDPVEARVWPRHKSYYCHPARACSSLTFLLFCELLDHFEALLSISFPIAARTRIQGQCESEIEEEDVEH